MVPVQYINILRVCIINAFLAASQGHNFAAILIEINKKPIKVHNYGDAQLDAHTAVTWSTLGTLIPVPIPGVPWSSWSSRSSGFQVYNDNWYNVI
jgi:hypothetical protein